MITPPSPRADTGRGSVVHVVGAALVRGTRCLVAQRSATMSAPLRWELPGGKVETGETPERALRREIREELGIEIAVGGWLGRGTAADGGRTIVLDVYRAALVDGEPEAREHQALRWVDADQLHSLGWADADILILPALETALRAR